MATNCLSRTRRSFVSVKKIAEQYDVSDKQIYKLLAMPVFAEAVKRVGPRKISVDQDKFYEINEQYFK